MCVVRFEQRSEKMNKLKIKRNKVCLASWKRIKNNGNTAKKRRELLNKIISPDVNQIENKVPSANNQEKNHTEHVDNAEILFQENHEPTSQNESESESENDNECAINWEIELEDDFISNNSEIIDDRHILFKQSLAYWSGLHGIKREALNDLLCLLNETLPDLNLPKDSRTIKKTPTEKTIISEDTFGGSYWHYGLANALNKCLAHIEHCQEVLLNVNIDGLPLFRSSRVEFWPILFNIHGKPEVPPMAIGIYCGKGWLKRLEEYNNEIIFKFTQESPRAWIGF